MSGMSFINDSAAAASSKQSQLLLLLLINSTVMAAGTLRMFVCNISINKRIS